MAGDGPAIPGGIASVDQSANGKRSEGGVSGRARAGFFTRRSTCLLWCKRVVHIGPQTLGRKSKEVHPAISRITGGDQFHRDVHSAGTKHLSGEQRKFAIAIWADALPSGAFYSGQSFGRNGSGPLLQF